MKTKNADDSSEALRRLFDRIVRAPICTVSFDFGTEFTNRKSQDIMKKYNVYHFFLREPKKAFFAELFVKLVQQLIHKYMALHKTKRYIDQLTNIEHARNTRKLKALNYMRPIDVTFENSHKVFEKLYPKYKKFKSTPYKIGQKVLLANTKGHFSKAYQAANFDPDKIYEISRIHTSPVSSCVRYSLRDTSDGLELNGTFYKEEIQLIKDIKER